MNKILNNISRLKGLGFRDLTAEPGVVAGTDCFICIPRHLDYPFEREVDPDDEGCSWQGMYRYQRVSN